MFLMGRDKRTVTPWGDNNNIDSNILLWKRKMIEVRLLAGYY